MKETLIHGLVSGLTGAAVSVASEAAVTRIDAVRSSRVRMGIARTLLGAVSAAGLAKAGAPSSVACGALAGPVMLTAVDLLAEVMPRRRQIFEIGF